ncbi:hypothetical protein NEUTE1DRAFT_127183 [Neurospora tetrasperma FGSC 2508]|uniref:Uncharacterized protein n=1 Tax=Neurospora tetrasperma (strain FGSC 2508 / ATCC MYA-4615 / P0657) TaxID=510951 RepID=F8MBE9_NEUT8|nr:uncharacterized protein NEUTE1DRAFT_127183 [Neurospora tetrasperma FGSC 2508]EGO60261.1 hypothetical protein NEUTE1DRAFT_127183 [Neurospora tetrasperma FGSC 2508]EGZ75777.1 hypothetical protein NEUTE2DRAFT_156170 [Neurospora tetrasperma FGSC 2509]
MDRPPRTPAPSRFLIGRKQSQANASSQRLQNQETPDPNQAPQNAASRAPKFHATPRFHAGASSTPKPSYRTSAGLSSTPSAIASSIRSRTNVPERRSRSTLEFIDDDLLPVDGESSPFARYPGSVTRPGQAPEYPEPIEFDSSFVSQSPIKVKEEDADELDRERSYKRRRLSPVIDLDVEEVEASSPPLPYEGECEGHEVEELIDDAESAVDEGSSPPRALEHDKDVIISSPLASSDRDFEKVDESVAGSHSSEPLSSLPPRGIRSHEYRSESEEGLEGEDEDDDADENQRMNPDLGGFHGSDEDHTPRANPQNASDVEPNTDAEDHDHEHTRRNSWSTSMKPKGQNPFLRAPRFKPKSPGPPDPPPDVSVHHTLLPDIFSPQRHRGARYVPGGLASELREWLLEVKGGSSTEPTPVAATAHLAVETVKKCGPGISMTLVTGRPMIGGPNGTKVPRSYRALLAGDGRMEGLSGSGAGVESKPEGEEEGADEPGRKPLVPGAMVAIAPPAWDIDLGEEEEDDQGDKGKWAVAYRWDVL